MKNKAPSIPMTARKSSQIESTGYDPESRTLAVKYLSGATYHYVCVSQEAHSAMLKAKSIGSHLHSHIKGKFDHKKIGA